MHGMISSKRTSKRTSTKASESPASADAGHDPFQSPSGSKISTLKTRLSKWDLVQHDEAAVVVPWFVLWGSRLIYFCIIANATTLGLEADYPEERTLWRIFENVFTIVFVAEMLIKLWYYREAYFHDHWNVMDCVLAWLAVIDVWILALLEESGDLRSFMALKIIRLLRLVRMARMLRLKKELVVLVEGLWSSVKSLAWIGVLLFVIIYTSAIFCKSTVEEFPREFFDTEYHFGSIQKSMLTLFNMCILDEWGGIVRPLFERQPYIVFFFFCYIMIVTFGVLNLIIGIIAERTLESSGALRDEQEDELKRAKMKDILAMIDEIFVCDTDGGLTVEELESEVDRNPRLMGVVTACDLPKGFGIGDLHLMFDEEYGGSVSKEEFTTGMFRLVFNNDFHRSCCLQMTVAQVKKEVKECCAKLQTDFRVALQEVLGGEQEQKFREDNVSQTPLSLSERKSPGPKAPLAAHPNVGVPTASPAAAIDEKAAPIAGGAELSDDAEEICRRIDASVRRASDELLLALAEQRSEMAPPLKELLAKLPAREPVPRGPLLEMTLAGSAGRGVARVRAVDCVFGAEPVPPPAMPGSCMPRGTLCTSAPPPSAWHLSEDEHGAPRRV